jgi:putative phage-type endonuclease
MLQRSPEWYAAKLGKVGASRISDIMARTKSGYSASRANYMAELVCERLTGKPSDNYVSPAMQWGIDNEVAAKAAYSFMTDYHVTDCGFYNHPVIQMAGASPDGWVGTGRPPDGLIEIKCPNTATHIETLMTETIEGKYVLQMQFQMACTGTPWCDFVSFDPRLPPEMQLWIRRVHYDAGKVKEIEAEVSTFLAELADKMAALQSRYMKEAA